MPIIQTLEQHIAERSTPERVARLERATAFFLENAGTSHHPDFETREQGALRGAKRLAAAELYGLDQGWTVEWSDDWDGDHSYTDDSIESCESAVLRDEDDAMLGSFGCVDDATDDYRRVVAAELMLEAVPELHDPMKLPHYYEPKDSDIATCGTCGVQWCVVCHPSPSDRCHQEAEHDEPDDDLDDDDLDDDDLDDDDLDDVIDAVREHRGDYIAMVEELVEELRELRSK